MLYDNLDNKLDVKNFRSFNKVNKNNTNIFIFNIEENNDLINTLYHNYLSKEEILKARRFLISNDKNLYILGKYITREILSCYLGVHPKSIVFDYNYNKKNQESTV